jgi:uncharacterized membrane protein
MQRAEKSVRVAAPASEVYRFWRDFENLPKFMEHVKEVHRSGSGQELWHWTLKGPLNTSFGFDARLTEDQPNKSIGWNSIEGSLGTSGVVTFTELENNTEVHVVMQWFDMPAGRAGESLSRILQDPDRMLEEDLRRLKDMLERRVRADVEAEALSMKSTLED